MHQIHKYPRTHHIEGSRFQPGDEDLESVPFRRIAGSHLVVEEKVDGANCAISFSIDGHLLLQSRGHYLTGGLREKQFTLFKQWASTHEATFRERLTDRYVMYGEWLYAKHTVFYDHLPHYFLEFDVFDTQNKHFLSTPSRRNLLKELPIVSVRVLHQGPLRKKGELMDLVGPSEYISTGHIDRLRLAAEERDVDPDRAVRETDASCQMEGLYLKVENGHDVSERYKFVRSGFLAAVSASEGHWLNRPIIPNILRPDVELFGDQR